MAGYKGYSMSNNAVDAYETGEMPLSKWTKSEMLNAYDRVCKEYDLKRYDLSKVKVSTLKSCLLKLASWHHTSNFYNKTDFYEIDINFCEELNQEKVDKIMSYKEEKIEAAEPSVENWEVAYLTWGGTRKHPKATEHREVVEYDKSKNYVLTNYGKKMISANGFHFIKKIEDQQASIETVIEDEYSVKMRM